MRYLIYAERAQSVGFLNVARLFTAIASAEQVHASNHYRNISSTGAFNTVGGALFGTRTPSEDLQAGIDGETFEVNEMYPTYIAIAKLQQERAAEISFTWAWESEKIHASLFQKAKQAVDDGRDVDLGPIQVCNVCGYTIEGDAPEICPVCKTLQAQFKTYV